MNPNKEKKGNSINSFLTKFDDSITREETNVETQGCSNGGAVMSNFGDGIKWPHLEKTKKLVDLIQEDFPRTPSPVFAQLVDDEAWAPLRAASTPLFKQKDKVDNLVTQKHPLWEHGISPVQVNRTSIMENELENKFSKLNLDVDKFASNNQSVHDLLDKWETPDTLDRPPSTLTETKWNPNFAMNNFNWNNNVWNNSNLPLRTQSVNEFKSQVSNNWTQYDLNSMWTNASFIKPFESHYYNPSSTSGYQYQFMPNNTARSVLLEEYRNSKIANPSPNAMVSLPSLGRRLELKDIVGLMLEFSSDQHGSRFIQFKLETTNNLEDKNLVFNEIFASSLILMTDVFGNYVIQKFLEFGSDEHRDLLAIKMKGHILELSLQMYGCRVVQKALEHMNPEQQNNMVQELNGNVLQCVKDQNGNHVIQKAIEKVAPNKNIQFIIESFKGHIYNLATHPYGCRVIQRVFEFCLLDQIQIILDELHEFIETLMLDQYGNYVVQHVLENAPLLDRTMVIKKVIGKIANLSMHKFASNVVEKCVAYATPQERQVIVNEVVSMNNNIPCIVLMMKDQYANYVVQKMLDVVTHDQQMLLIKYMDPHLPQLKKLTYGKHLILKIDKLLN